MRITNAPTSLRRSTPVLVASGVGAAAVVLSMVVMIGSADGVATAPPKAAADPGPAIQRQFVQAVKNIRPSVVEISSTAGLGSGVVYDAQGDIVTNAHVVGASTSFTVSLSDGTRLPARLVGTFVPDDLAVIRVTSNRALKPAHFGDSSSLEVGEIVLAVGNPFGLSSSVTEGIVSFNGRAVSEGNGVMLPDLVQTSAPINPGNSGGALVDLSGYVVGTPTLAASDGSSPAPGIGFAIPSNTVKLIAPQLISAGKVTKAGRAALGISGSDAIDFRGTGVGVAVTAVMPNGAAAKAGIVPGDLITAINTTPVTDFSALQRALALLKPGDAVKVAFTNTDGEHETVSVVLGDLAGS